MKNKALLVALACAIGSGIGTMLALNYHTIWYVGLLVGGIIGYLVYDIKEVAIATPKAWEFARKNIGKLNYKFWIKFLWFSFCAVGHVERGL